MMQTSDPSHPFIERGPGGPAWITSVVIHAFFLVVCMSLWQPIHPRTSEPFHWTISLVDPSDLQNTTLQSTAKAANGPTSATPIMKQPTRPPNMTPTRRQPTISTHSTKPSEMAGGFEPAHVSHQSIAALSETFSSSPRDTESNTALNEPTSLAANTGDLDATITRPESREVSPVPLSSALVSAAPVTADSISSETHHLLADSEHKELMSSTSGETSASSSEQQFRSGKPDYGWLQQAIFQRLEELKRSSRPSLDDSRPLKVMVKAVVSREGILLDSAVVKSSGLDRIDQEAMALVQRAFPMQLDRPLDRQQVAMRIPITYSRD